MLIGQELVVVKVSSDIQNVKGSGPSTQGKDLQGFKPRSGTAPMMKLAECQPKQNRERLDSGYRIYSL